MALRKIAKRGEHVAGLRNNRLKTNGIHLRASESPGQFGSQSFWR